MPTLAVTCTGNSPHYGNGCALLKHYDTDNDGIIGKHEWWAAEELMMNGVITEEEFQFVLAANKAGSINALCPGCYTPPTLAVTCTGNSPHYGNGCALLKHYDANKNGIIDDAEVSAAEYSASIGDLTPEEIKFVRAAWTAGSINDLCADCPTRPPAPECKEGDKKPGYVCSGGKWVPAGAPPKPVISGIINSITSSPIKEGDYASYSMSITNNGSESCSYLLYAYDNISSQQWYWGTLVFSPGQTRIHNANIGRMPNHNLSLTFKLKDRSGNVLDTKSHVISLAAPPIVCTEGAKRGKETCWDSSVIYKEVCAGGRWAPTGQTCPDPAPTIRRLQGEVRAMEAQVADLQRKIAEIKTQYGI